jgi:ankyrin repeat protein
MPPRLRVPSPNEPLTVRAFFSVWFQIHAMAFVLMWEQITGGLSWLRRRFFTKETLMQALERGATTHQVSRLVRGGADLSQTDAKGRNALHVALDGWDEAEDEEEPAQASARLELLQWLINHQAADVNERDQQERTPIHMAVQAGLHEVVRSLLDARADPTMLCKGATTLRQAVVRRDAEMVSLLLYGAASSVAQDGKLAVEDGNFVNRAHRDGWAALGLAARAGDAAIVEALLDAGADVTVVNASGKTALDAARLNKHDAVAALLEARSEPESSAGGAPSVARAAVPRRPQSMLR